LCSELNAFQRQYVGEIKQCEELERIIRYFHKLITEAGIPIPKSKEKDIQNVDLFELENTFEEYEKDMIQYSDGITRLQEQVNRCKESSYVIKACLKTLTEDANIVINDEHGETIVQNVADADIHSADLHSQTEEVLIEDNGSLSPVEEKHAPQGLVTGVVAQNKIPSMRVLVNRASRGNSIPEFADIEEPMYDVATGKEIQKSVFAVFFPIGENLHLRITKISQSLGATIYKFPENAEEVLEKLTQQTLELETTLKTATERRNDFLKQIAAFYEERLDQILAKKAIYNIMNMYTHEIHDSAIAEGWLPTKYIPKVRETLEEAQKSSGVRLQSILEEIVHQEIPPTYFETNKFTSAFQEIVNAYGVPRYKEMNPAVFTIITFPFLFAVMFGDWGHGIILTLFAASLCIFEKKLAKVAAKSELFGMLFQGRYIVLLMGLFSIWTGLLYNDIFGLAIDICGTSYPTFETDSRNSTYGVFTNETYPFGVDPAWYGTANKLLFYNSLKMKMSVIFGIGQMSLGIILAGINMLYFRHIVDFFVEFIPELFILLCTFGYMCLLIIIKWSRDWRYISGGVPAVLPTMTDFFLKFYSMEQPRIYGTAAGKEQDIIQICLLAIAAVMIPILLLPKPIYDHLHAKYKKKKQGKQDVEMRHRSVSKVVISAETNESAPIDPSQINIEEDVKSEPKTEPQETIVEMPQTEHQEVEDDPFSERLIKQLIHTIEFVLGVVSNTASYLRLWALSLAHAQLSEVFWDMTMNLMLSSSNEGVIIFISTGIAPFLMFIVWFILTIAVLLGMESLSAFLHALRLHWVEFQNKFFVGDGHLFEPFNLDLVLKDVKLQQSQAEDE
jgi:V-type H+-transporting ATPase subunit a